jgi:GTP-binding protein
LLALVGRPNVGKSTLFNKLVSRRTAIVEDMPGVTRDRNYADANWEGRALSVVDTGGFEPVRSATRGEGRPLMQRVQEQAQLAVDEAAAVILVVDGREGLTEVDRALAHLLRRSGKPLYVAANKIDSEASERRAPLADFHALGFGEVYAVSAEHGRGVADLVGAIIAELGLPADAVEPEPEAEPFPELDPDADEEGKDLGPPIEGDIRLAIVGRPNVGKSTFVNALLGQERLVVSEVAGTTRDSIDSVVEHGGRQFIVTDTAGIRRKRSIAQRLEAYSVVRAMRSIDQAEVVACLLDAGEAGVDQDARILGLIAEKGRAFVIVVNKWDLAEKESATRAWYREQLHKRLPFVAYAPMLFTSAAKKQGVEKVLTTAARLSAQFRARFPTPALNDLIEAIQEDHPAPLAHGRPVRLYYAAQVGYAPPTFVIQCSRPEAIGDPYRRFVENRIREAFGLEVPMRIIFKERRRKRRTGR